jgi:glyoxylase-like metal-dependent hydrolase (beta-lactamase superfamily II)
MAPGALVGELLRACPGPLPGGCCYLLLTEGLIFTGAQLPPRAWLHEHEVAWLAAREGFMRPVAPLTARPTEETR